VTELAHLGYVVPDMQRALKRFQAEGAVVVIAPTEDPIQRVSCCLLRCDGAVDIELVAPLIRGDSPVDARLKRGGGLDHVCYYVDDLDAAVAAEIEAGSMVVCEPVHAVTFDRHIAFVQRRSGLVVELMAREPASP
jgi:methylmalonyl-CoA/ethylmalonyl-CoA epimerase